jgi:hypothetical protein
MEPDRDSGGFAMIFLGLVPDNIGFRVDAIEAPADWVICETPKAVETMKVILDRHRSEKCR